MKKYVFKIVICWIIFIVLYFIFKNFLISNINIDLFTSQVNANQAEYELIKRSFYGNFLEKLSILFLLPPVIYTYINIRKQKDK